MKSGNYRGIPRLRAVPSTGAPAEQVDGQLAPVATPCGGCQRLTEQGEPITKYRGTWWHLFCANLDANAGNPDQAWLALGYDLARSPRAYNVRESRAIIGALLGMLEDARRPLLEPDGDLPGQPA